MKTNQKTEPVQASEINLKDIIISPFNYRYGGKPVDDNSLTELS